MNFPKLPGGGLPGGSSGLPLHQAQRLGTQQRKEQKRQTRSQNIHRFKRFKRLNRSDYKTLAHLDKLKNDLINEDLWRLSPDDVEIIVLDNDRKKVVQFGVEKPNTHADCVQLPFKELFSDIKPQVKNIAGPDGQIDRRKILTELETLKKRLQENPTARNKIIALNISLGPYFDLEADKPPTMRAAKFNKAYRAELDKNASGQNPYLCPDEKKFYQDYQKIIETLGEVAQYPNVVVGVSAGNEEKTFNGLALADRVKVFTGTGLEGASPIPGAEAVEAIFPVTETPSGWSMSSFGSPTQIAKQVPPVYNIFHFFGLNYSSPKKLKGTSIATPVGLSREIIFLAMARAIQEATKGVGGRLDSLA